MEHDVIILYLIAGVSFTFALFNCILFALKHGKTMKTDGTIVSIKSTNPTNEKWRNAKLAEVSYLVNGKRIVSKNRIQVSLASDIGTHIPIRYDRNQPDKIYSYSVKRIIIGFLIGVGSILIAVFMQIHQRKGIQDMPRFPEWFIVICVLFPIANLIYKAWKNRKKQQSGGNDEKNGMDTLPCLWQQNP